MIPSLSSVQNLLGLTQRATCGFMRETYMSEQRLPAGALPAGYNGERHIGNVFSFLVTTEAAVMLHRIPSDQMYHHYLGDPLEVLLLHRGGAGELRTVGTDLVAGMRPQLVVPGGTFHAARVRGTLGWALLGTSVWIKAEPKDVEMGDPAKLTTSFPSMAAEIAAFSA